MTKKKVIKLQNGKTIDFFKFCKVILGYDRLNQKNKEWCKTLERERLKRKRLMFLKPRGTYKTTIYTVSYPIWRIVQSWYENNGDIPIRILLTCSTTELAVQYLNEIKQHFLTNERLKYIFRAKIERDTQQEIWFKRRTIHKEPTIKAKGAFASMTGEHYDLIICDDIVNNDDRESESVRKKKIRWFQDLISILEPDGEVLVVGTRWHENDLYNHIIEQNENLPEENRYHIEVESVIDEEGNLVFPDIYDYAAIERLKVEKGLVEFYSQYMNNPLPSETQLFKFENFSFYTDEERFFSEDLAKHYIYCDPALGQEGDYSVVLVGAVRDGNLYVRDAFISNTTTPEKVIEVIEFFNQRYSPVKVGIESNGFQTLFASAVKKRAIPVVEVKNIKNKRVRIEGLEPFITNGTVLFREDWKKVYPELIEQLVRFPVHKYDDCPDALEGLLRISLKSSYVPKLTGLVKGVRR